MLRGTSPRQSRRCMRATSLDSTGCYACRCPPPTHHCGQPRPALARRAPLSGPPNAADPKRERQHRDHAVVAIWPKSVAERAESVSPSQVEGARTPVFAAAGNPPMGAGTPMGEDIEGECSN